ncbi:MAG: hypothetical protein IJ171_08880, partial [Ruminococcus sp.]|nr:hypothetical protein [Ruminococcus sp.]
MMAGERSRAIFNASLRCSLRCSIGNSVFELMVSFVSGMVIFLSGYEFFVSPRERTEHLLSNGFWIQDGIFSCIFSSATLGFVPSIPLTPAAADTIYRYLQASASGVSDYDMIYTGDLGRVGSRLLRDLLSEKGVDLGERHSDCGMMIFDENQDVHAGGSGCGCCASVLCGYILRKMQEGLFRNI